MKNIDQIVFFNHWRHGDSFVNKAYVKQIIDSFPELKFSYAHQFHPSIVADLKCQHRTLEQLPEGLTWHHPMGTEFGSKTMYINTWPGNFRGRFFGEHPTLPAINHVWNEIFNHLDLPLLGDYSSYLPFIDFDCYDLDRARFYLTIRHIPDRPMILFCNGPVKSSQSDVTEMTVMIDRLSALFPGYEFLTTYPTGLDKANLTCTDDVFETDTGNINQIAYLSQFATLVIGKNSGPFTYSQHRANLINYKKKFLCYGKSSSDWILGDGKYYCDTYFSSTTDENVMVQQVLEILPQQPSKEKKSVRILDHV